MCGIVTVLHCGLLYRAVQLCNEPYCTAASQYLTSTKYQISYQTVHYTVGFSSLEEHVEQKKQEKIRLKIEKDKTKVKGLTAEGRKKISDRCVLYFTCYV
jgi:hypothetical protein